MTRFLLARLAWAVVTLLGMSLIVFVVMRSSGDPVDLYLPITAGVEQREALRTGLGLDRPLPQQYLGFVADAVRGDLGTSITYHLPVWDLISGGLWQSVRLTLVAVTVAFVGGVALGVTAAMNPGSWPDRLARGVALFGMSVPSFWFGIVLILVFSTWVTWLPAGGNEGIRSIVLPALTLALFPLAGWVKVTRSAMLEVLASDFVLLERLSGFRSRRIVWKYAFKNALIPAVSFLGLVLGPTVGGAVVVESVFAWPGIGRTAVNAITHRDYPVIQGIVLVVTTIVIVVNCLVDITYGIIDPRLSRA